MNTMCRFALAKLFVLSILAVGSPPASAFVNGAVVARGAELLAAGKNEEFDEILAAHEDKAPLLRAIVQEYGNPLPVVKNPQWGNVFASTPNGLGSEVHVLTSTLRAYHAYATGEAIAAVLDIGPGSGWNQLPVIQRKNAWIYVLDPGEQHLAWFARRATDEGEAARVQLTRGYFPADLTMSPGAVDAILFSHVIHYMSGADIDAGLLKMHTWLKPGGKLFLQALTTSADPYNTSNKDDQTRAKQVLLGRALRVKIDAFEQRAKTNPALYASEWPTYIDGVERIAVDDAEVVMSIDYRNMPQKGHPQYLPVLLAHIEAAGFVIEAVDRYKIDDAQATTIDENDPHNAIGIVARRQ